MAVPALQVFIDWDSDGSFATAGDEVTADLSTSKGVNWTRGRSADYNAEATGAASFVLTNESGAYSPANNPDLVPGRPVLIKSTYSATERAHFYGFIQRIAPNHADRTVAITCYDPLKRLAETDIIVAANSYVQRSTRDMRIAILEDFERGVRNLVANPSFETDTSGWDTTTYGGGTLTRTLSTPYSGSACGEYVATGVGNRALYPVRLAPVFFAGQVYRFSVYLRTVSGTADWQIGLYTNASTIDASKTVTVTSTWTRFTVTLTLPSTVSASTDSGSLVRPTLYIRSLAAGTVRLDALSVTRGQGTVAYSDTGSGRAPNWCGNGSFDGATLGGWYDGWTNLIGNPSFETDTSGWSTTADAFHASGATLTRFVSDPVYGSARADLVENGSNTTGAHYTLSGTFKSGVTYAAAIWAKASAGSGSPILGIGSNGTPTDKGEVTGSAANGSYRLVTATWTPTADRTDAHLYIRPFSYQTLQIDGIQIARRDPATTNDPVYSNTGPGGGGSFVTTRALSATAKYGSQSHSVTTPATAGAGRVYDFAHLGSYFTGALPHTLSIWVQPTSNMPYRVGLGANKDDGTWDEASTTGTATANIWTQVTVTWTPTADHGSGTPFDVVLFVYQTDATARTFLIDGIRVIPGSSADAFEMAQWNLTAEPDVYGPSASLGGSALSALSALNQLSLSRHYIRPTLTSPFYQYVTSSRDDLVAKTSAETFTNDFTGLSEIDLDRESIVNIVPVNYAGSTIEYYSDEASIAKYGLRPGSAISGPSFFTDRTVPDIVGPALIARYKDPRGRPAMEVYDRFPSQLERELDDLITVTFGRLSISGQKYLILRAVTKTTGSLDWATVYTLEEHAF